MLTLTQLWLLIANINVYTHVEIWRKWNVKIYDGEFGKIPRIIDKYYMVSIVRIKDDTIIIDVNRKAV